ncbi:hypothetical protein VSH64_25080 [Amycolatopsis rhabdoformis]|uniref:Uncharacterized protein n=1 Tax=Amycolatopsis rhabdoformis TaxID=1448059 RepID=A0ABZ1HUW6_9PSEU|nr:hypothetical protein [Amycolatopsis rhabdoformis]WSE26152.1 hypothetical protein VSH64_25080 [Amycolatopsis rhabdoformis]
MFSLIKQLFARDDREAGPKDDREAGPLADREAARTVEAAVGCFL